MMKFVVPFLLVLASIGLVTGQRMCIQGGPVPDCNSFSLGLEAVWSQSSCQWECPKVCPNGDAFRSCDKCALMRCRDGTTCYNDRCAATCTGQCVPNPTSTPTTPPETPICTEACTAKCSAGQSCVLSTSCQPKCERSTANTCVLNDDNSRIVSGGKYYHQCNICECGANGQPGGCTKIGCGDGPFRNNGSTISQCLDCRVAFCALTDTCVVGADGCGKCVTKPTPTPTSKPTPTPATPTCDTLRGKDCPDDSWECVVSPCPTDVCVQRPGTCVKKPKICTEKCIAKCSAGDSCVFDKNCTPQCQRSTADTCLLNDNNSRIVSGGKYYHTCNLCTCMDGGQGACDRRGCPHSEEWNNDGSPVPPPSCNNFRHIACPDESWECVNNKCTSDFCIEPAGTCVKKPPPPTCHNFQNIKCPDESWECVTNKCPTDMCIFELPGTCVKRKICTEKCTAKCFPGDKCVLDSYCKPGCQSSTANTCLLNDGKTRVVSGGKYYKKCNLCTCKGECTEMACVAEAYFNSGAAIKLYTISFKVQFSGNRDELIAQLRTVAENALFDSTLVVIFSDKDKYIKKLTSPKNTYQCTIAIKGTKTDASNRDKYMEQLKNDLSNVKILENNNNNNNNNNNKIQLDGEIQIDTVDDVNTQPFTQTCPDDTTIPAMDECPAITDESIIIPSATSSDSSSFPLAIVIGSVVGGVIALVILTAAVIVVQRRRFNTIKSMDRMETEMTNNPAITSQV